MPVANRAFHAWAFGDVILNTSHNTINMTPRLENPNQITFTHYTTQTEERKEVIKQVRGTFLSNVGEFN